MDGWIVLSREEDEDMCLELEDVAFKNFPLVSTNPSRSVVCAAPATSSYPLFQFNSCSNACYFPLLCVSTRTSRSKSMESHMNNYLADV